LVVQGVLVQLDDGDPARSAWITTWTSSAVMTKSPLMAALPPPVGWKFSAVLTLNQLRGLGAGLVGAGVPASGDCSGVAGADEADLLLAQPGMTRRGGQHHADESPTQATFTLGQFFTEWKVRLAGTCLNDVCATSTGTWRFFVNGQPNTGDPTALHLAATRRSPPSRAPCPTAPHHPTTTTSPPACNSAVPPTVTPHDALSGCNHGYA
jgi:hypothetical protein